ncbi:hypothetical protein GCM10022276_23680 [Sphingomonas limnosediminicola]|uniref:PepSY domain-containing protein n=1 Tax=Sphingomonas limnosediminicola TaxID=940133 RepID=A0ABP7LN19_9SPHN
MRKWHRWLATLFGVFLLWISATGLLSQIGELVNKGGFESEARAAVAAPVAPPGFKCPDTMSCRPKQKPGAWNLGLLHNLHSGESFGPVGTIISIMSGLALLFFSFSGLWMYIQLWRGRLAKTQHGGKVRGGKFFW